MRGLIFAGLRHYRGIHAMVIAGVAIAVAVLAGALTVGASVKESLRELALGRLGNTHVVVASPTFFRQQLAADVGATPVVAATGSLVHDASGRMAARVQVFGIDDEFLRFHGIPGTAPRGRDAWISEPLAGELRGTTGDGLVLRLAKPTDIPLGTLQGRREDAAGRIRLTLSRIVDRRALGDFSLNSAQGPALTVFVPLALVQRDLEVEGRVNALLVSGDMMDVNRVLDAVARAAQLDDYGLRLRTRAAPDTIIIESRAGVMSQAVVDAVTRSAAAVGAPAELVLVHLANAIRIGTREIPYSIVAGRSMTGEIALNDWAAHDLAAKTGDRVDLEYYLWSDDTGLETRQAQLTLAAIVAMSGDGGDRTFTPDYPGLTDADDVSAWDPPFPVDLKRVRKQDEDYWDQWRGAPKAFVPLDVAQRLWATPYGRVSSVRMPVPPGQDLSAFAARIESTVRQQLDPTAAGIQIRDARAEALAAAEGTTDFGEYFFYFSFFLVVAGLLLAALFFTLGVEQRSHEIGLLTAAGFARRDIVRVFASQAGVLALFGSALGIAGAIGYAALIMYGLRTWWSGAVGTTALTLHVNLPLLLAGAGAALAAATAALVIALRSALRRTPRALLSGAPDLRTSRAPAASRRALLVALAIVAGALALLIATRAGRIPQVAGFFVAGAALMIAGLLAFSWSLRRPPARVAATSVARFGADYARWRPTRSVLSAALITFACFVIVSVGAFRRDPSGMSLDRRLGTGGFVLMAESVAPLMHNPNTATGRQELGLDTNPVWDATHIARFRLKPGDEASCLSLYQPRNPRIVAPEDAFVADGRFTFAHSLASTPAEQANPWLLLARRFDDGAIPAIADQTSLTYVFHLKVGDDYVFQPEGGPSTRVRIVGALADSVLQSELVIGEDAFVTLFPRREGYGVWMIDTAPDNAATLATVLEDRLADYGVDVTETRARLAAYHAVENTYLSTFQALGALGLLVGTLGIAAVLARNVLERRRELALLRAVGFTPRNLRTLVVAESLLLVGVGLVLGSSTAVFAVLPAVLERSGAVPFRSVALLLVAVTITGLISSILAARMATASSLVAALKSE